MSKRKYPRLTNSQRDVIVRLLAGEHINVYDECRFRLSGCGRLVGWSTVSALRHHAFISEYRQGNYELTPMGRAAAEYEGLTAAQLQ